MAEFKKIDANTLEITSVIREDKNKLLSYKQDLLDRKADTETKLAEVNIKLNVLK